MQVQAALCYRYIYDSTFVTSFLKSNINYTQPQGQHPPPPLPVKNSGCSPDYYYIISYVEETLLPKILLHVM